MSAVITGTVASTVTLSGQAFPSAACMSPDGLFVYLGCGNGFTEKGRIYRIPVSNFTTAAALILYPTAVLNANVTWLHVAPDGRTLLAIAGGQMFSLAVDGTSVAPILINAAPSTTKYSAFNVGETMYCTATNASGLFTMDPATGVLTVAFKAGTEFTLGIGPCRYKAGTLLTGANLNTTPSYLYEYELAKGQNRVILGNGTNVLVPGPAYSSGIVQSEWISSDEDGRIYFTNGANIHRLDPDGTVSAVLAATATFMMHSFQKNCLIKGAGYDWAKLT